MERLEWREKHFCFFGFFCFLSSFLSFSHTHTHSLSLSLSLSLSYSLSLSLFISLLFFFLFLPPSFSLPCLSYDSQVVRHHLVDMHTKVFAAEAAMHAVAQHILDGKMPVAEICMLKNQVGRDGEVKC